MTSANLHDISNTDVESNWDQIVDNFDDMDLKPELFRGIYAYGLEHPSVIQQRAIVPVIKGHDCIVQAQPSTGKTVALSIAVLQTIDTSTKDTQALILAPTRELAQNIQKVIVALGHHMGIECHACVGGTNVREEKAKLQEGVHIVVGTPGRVHDMIDRHALRVDNIKLFCLDEADEMLSRGFVDQVHDVFKQLPQATQVVLFSDTLPEDVLDTTEKSVRALKDPVQILVKKNAFTLEDVKQFYINVKKKQKSDTLCDMYNIFTKRQIVVLCNSRRTVESLAEKMRSRNLMVSAMHGQTEQKQREGLIQDFHSGSTRFLISTDLHMRGFDVQEVPLVVNYDLPTNSKDYIYRISRKSQGVVINFVTIEDAPMLRDIEKLYSTQLAEAPADIADVI